MGSPTVECRIIPISAPMSPISLGEGRRQAAFEGMLFRLQVEKGLLQVAEVAIVEAVEVYWKDYLAIPPLTFGDTLLLAEELAPVASRLRKLGGEEAGEGMTARMDITLGQDVLASILEESAEEVASPTGALKF